MAQKAIHSGQFFQACPGRKPRRQKEHQPEPQHPIDAQECRVAMHRCRIEPLHGVEGARRVDEKAEQPGPHKGPEGDRHEKRHGPAVGGQPAPCPC